MSESETGAEAAPFIPYAEVDALPDALKAPIEAYVARMGFLPNALKLYMHRPEILECLIKLNNTVMRHPSGTLEVALKRRIAALCSALNHSPYCVAHNANTLKADAAAEGEGWGLSQVEVAALLDPGFVPEDAAERACFAYARAATADPSSVPQAVLESLAEHLTPPQVVELACVVGFWRMYNSNHEALYVPLEAELLGGAEISADEILGELSGAPQAAPPAAGQAEVEIYTRADCSFCRRAKRLLQARGIAYTEHPVDDDAARRAEMIERAQGRETVPQIFIDGRHIGGMDDLAQLAKAGKLDEMLGLSKD